MVDFAIAVCLQCFTYINRNGPKIYLTPFIKNEDRLFWPMRFNWSKLWGPTSETFVKGVWVGRRHWPSRTEKTLTWFDVPLKLSSEKKTRASMDKTIKVYLANAILASCHLNSWLLLQFYVLLFGPRVRQLPSDWTIRILSDAATCLLRSFIEKNATLQRDIEPVGIQFLRIFLPKPPSNLYARCTLPSFFSHSQFMNAIPWG